MNNKMLDKVKILLVDPDIHIARVIIQNLRAMNFSSIQHVKTAEQAIEYMHSNHVDILITEWMLAPTDGIELVKQLRLGKKTPNRGLPIIMLTGKGEMLDVQAARDIGITEFVVKPFTVKTLYDRIEHLIEHPRPFVVSTNFVGPDRRRRELKASEIDRRTVKPKPAQKRGGKVPDIEATPMLLPADHEIKRNIGLMAPLSTIITPAMLAAAQEAIDNMQEESLQWIKEDLARLEMAYAKVVNGGEATEQMKEAALSIKSRAGTFGYALPSVVARILYLFLSTDYRMANPTHQQVISQCIQALKFMFAKGIKARGGVGEELVSELEKLIGKIKN